MAIFPRLCLEIPEGTRPYLWDCSDCCQSTPMCGRSSTNVPVGFTLSVVCFCYDELQLPFFFSLQFSQQMLLLEHWHIKRRTQYVSTWRMILWWDQMFPNCASQAKVVGSCWTKALKTWCSKSPVGHIQAPMFLRVRYYVIFDVLTSLEEGLFVTFFNKKPTASPILVNSTVNMSNKDRKILGPTFCEKAQCFVTIFFSIKKSLPFHLLYTLQQTHKSANGNQHHYIY